MVRDYLVRPAHYTDEKIKAPGVSPGSRGIRGSSSTPPPTITAVIFPSQNCSEDHMLGDTQEIPSPDHWTDGEMHLRSHREAVLEQGQSPHPVIYHLSSPSYPELSDVGTWLCAPDHKAATCFDTPSTRWAPRSPLPLHYRQSPGTATSRRSCDQNLLSARIMSFRAPLLPSCHVSHPILQTRPLKLGGVRAHARTSLLVSPDQVPGFLRCYP